MVKNIVLFVADDLGYGDITPLGAEKISTPNLERLAQNGWIARDCHAASAVCTPSRYGILTGSFPWRSPLKKGVLGGSDPAIIERTVPTIATYAKRAGFVTGAFGKWHLGLGWQSKAGTVNSAFEEGWTPDMQGDGREIDYSKPFLDGPLDHGFDRFFGIAGSLDMPPYCFLSQDRTVGIPDREKEPRVTSQRPGLQVEGWKDDEVDTTVTREALEWISDQVSAKQGFLAYVASAAPHRPCVPPEFIRGKSQAGLRGDSVMLVDWMVGRILELLDELGVLDDTLFIFTSDNGAPMIFPEDGDVVHHRPNSSWRGQKADVFEGGHRVPLIACGPGSEAFESDTPMSLLDLLPTLCTLMGLSDRSETDGIDLVSSNSDAERVIGVSSYDGSLVLRKGNCKAIWSSGSGGFSEPVGRPAQRDQTGQMYNLEQDPSEREDLAGSEWNEAMLLRTEFESVTGYEDPDIIFEE